MANYTSSYTGLQIDTAIGNVANKVDKETGKGLSTNDFTATYKDNVDANTTARHTHSNKEILDNTTASFTTSDKTKLDGIDLSTYSLITETGNKIDLSIDSSTYVMTLLLKDKNDNTLSTGTIDLPLETMVVNASYDNTNKKIILTLKNGTTVDVPVGDLVSGLITESQANTLIVNDKLTGSTAPTTSTIGYVGQFYLETTNDEEYVCTDVTTVEETTTYIWKKIGVGNIVVINESDSTAIKSAKGQQIYDYEQNNEEYIAVYNTNNNKNKAILTYSLVTTGSFYLNCNFKSTSDLAKYGITYNNYEYINLSFYVIDGAVSFHDITNAKNYSINSEARMPLGVMNETAYMPTSNYHPVVKKYVDDNLANYTPTSSLGSLATKSSVDYETEVTNKPTVPTKTSDLTNDSDFITDEVDTLKNYTKTNDLGELATKDTVDYETEVTNKPTIPTKTVVTINKKVTEGTNIADITIDGTTTELYAPTSGGGSTTWGSITGTLSSQTDLNTALTGKQDVFRYTTMPTASAELLNTTVQYIGTGTPDYFPGYFYICTSDELETPTYKWEPMEVQQPISEIEWGHIVGTLSSQTDLTSTLEGKQNTFQYGTVPTATAEIVGKVIQYMGTTTSEFTRGLFYECKLTGEETYGWEIINVQDVSEFATQEQVVHEIKNDKLIGSTAPTTATVGYIGQIYLDNVNNNMYICKNVDTVEETTTYTWTRIATTDYVDSAITSAINASY